MTSIDRRSLLSVMLAILSACGSGGGIGADGGQSGTGFFTTVRGNVVMVENESQVSDIRVRIDGTAQAALTDDTGLFVLQSEVSGAAVLLFERARDGLNAKTDILIPTGGVLELREIVLDRQTGEAKPTTRRVEFDGLVDSLECATGSIFVVSMANPSGTVFRVEVATASIRAHDLALSCADLLVGDRIEIEAETTDGVTLVNARIELEDREEDSDDDVEVEFGGFVDSLDCDQGSIFVVEGDDWNGKVFRVEADSASIEADGVPLSCDELLVGDRIEIEAETFDGVTLVNARIELEDREDSPGDDDDDEDDRGENGEDDADDDDDDDSDEEDEEDEPGDDDDDSDGENEEDDPDNDGHDSDHEDEDEDEEDEPNNDDDDDDSDDDDEEEDEPGDDSDEEDEEDDLDEQDEGDEG